MNSLSKKENYIYLQCRNGKKTAKAAGKIAFDLYNEGIIDKDQALIDPTAINQIIHRQIDPKAKKTILSKGLNAFPGVVYGNIVFIDEDAEKKLLIDRQFYKEKKLHLMILLICKFLKVLSIQEEIWLVMLPLLPEIWEPHISLDEVK